MDESSAFKRYKQELEQISKDEAAKQKKQHQKGKFSAKQRVELLLDKGSWTEFQQFAAGGIDDKELMNDGVIIGVGTIEGQRVCVFAQDFTVAGGSLGAIHAKKIVWLMDLAADMNAPIIGLNDSGGARIQEGIEALHGYGLIFERNVKYSGVVPQISVILGPCAGGAVYSPALTDFIFMVERTSQMFITGPKVVEAITGSEVKAEVLGGAHLHANKSGNIHFSSSSEKEILLQVRQLVSSWCPLNGEMVEDAHRPSCTNILPLERNKGYDVRAVISTLVDKDSFLEVQEKYARNLVVGFARLAGQSIGIVANNPKVMAGCIDVDAADKCARFVRFCDAFNHPLLVLEDVSGFMPGVQQEQLGLIRHGAKIVYAFAEATVPKITVILRKAYGGAFVALNSKALGADFVYAWPGSEVSVMGPEGAASILYADEKKDSEKMVDRINHYREHHADSRHAAKKAFIDEIIYPNETRERLILSYSLIKEKNRLRVHKKHGNIPL